MALFSRKSTKAKKAEKEEEAKKAAAVAKAKAPQRGRNGEIIVPTLNAGKKAAHDIAAPSQLPRDFRSLQGRPLAPGHSRIHSFEEHDKAEDGKQDYSNSHLSSDSGYVSPGPRPRVHARAASAQHARRDQDYLPMPQHTLGEDFAQELIFGVRPIMRGDAVSRHDGHHRQPSGGRPLKPSTSLQAMRDEASRDQVGPLPTSQPHQYQHQDGRHQLMVQQSMPLRPSSVPAQALQSRQERLTRLLPQRSLSPGPLLQNIHTGLSTRSNISAPLNTNSRFDWEASPTRNNQLQPSPSESRSPTSLTARNASSSFDQDESSPSLNILNGLKVNRRGLILDEEGDPIGELFEGDILDCVRQKADAYGNVLDEYGRVVGKVQTLSIRSIGTSLRRSASTPGTKRRREASPPPPVPALKPAVPAHKFDEAQQVHTQRLTHVSSYDAKREYASSTTETSSATSRHDDLEQEEHMSARPYSLQGSEIPLQQGGEELIQQQEPSSPRQFLPETSARRSESLPSVLESRSTAEVALSDNGTNASDENHHATTGHGSEQLSEDTDSSEQAFVQQSKAKSVHNATVQQPQVVTNNGVALAVAPVTAYEQSLTGSRQTEQPHHMSAAPSINRSISERAPASAGLPPLPQMPRNFSAYKQPAQPQHVGFPAPLIRGKSVPLPAFPGRTLSVGLADGNYNGPMPGLPNRRLTASGFPVSHGMSGLPGVGAHSPLNKSRNSTPLVRSPLSSHETSPPESATGSTKGYFIPVYAQTKSHARSQSLQTGSTTLGGAGAGKPRKAFAHAGQATGKQADINVSEIGGDKKGDKKKKGIKGFFGRKKSSA